MPRALALLLIFAACGPDGLPGPAPQSTKQAVDDDDRATNFQIVQNGTTSVQFFWTNNSPQLASTHYELRKSFDDGLDSELVAGDISPAATSYEDDNEPNAQSPDISWRLCLKDDIGIGQGACTPWTGLDPNSPNPPIPPRILSLEPIAGSPRVYATWYHRGEEFFEVSVPGNPPTTISQVPATGQTLSLLFDYDTPNTYPAPGSNSITIKVCATWEFEPSCTYESYDSFTVGPRPTAAPVVQQLSSTAHDRVTLVWTHGSNDETGFRVWWKNGDTFQRIGATSPTTLSFTHLGVPPGTTQEYRVCAVSAGGSTCSPTFTAQVPRQRPLPPNGLTARPVPNQIAQIRVEWQPFTQVADPITMIEVVRLNPDNSIGDQFMAPSTFLGYTDVNVQIDTLYRYYVRGINAAGPGEWGMAAVRLPIPVPNAPTGLVGVAEDSGNIDLTWNAPAAFPPVTTVRVDRLINGTFVRVFEAAPSVARYDEQSLNAATRYYFRVCSVNTYGEACTSTIGVTTLAAQLGAPTLDKPSSTRTTITLRWTPTVSTQVGYRLQRHNGSSYVDAAGAAATATEGTISNLTPSTPHKLRVCAVFSGGTRACSAGLTVTTNP